MRETPLDSHNKASMMEKMEITRQSRREFLSSKMKKAASVTLKRYPRLEDCLEKVEAEFEALTNSNSQTFVEQWNRSKPALLEFAKKTLKAGDAEGGVLIEQAENASTDWGNIFY